MDHSAEQDESTHHPADRSRSSGGVMAGVVAGATVAGTAFAYLSLAGDRGWPPFGGYQWAGLVFGGGAVIAAASTLTFLTVRGKLRVWTAVALIVVMSVGVAFVSSSLTRGSGHGSSTSSPEIAVDTPKGEVPRDRPVTVSGRLVQPLRQGESLWVFVGTLTDRDTQPQLYYQQAGPCAIDPSARSWRCSDIVVTSPDTRLIGVHVVGAWGGRPASLVRNLVGGAKFEAGSIDQDPRNVSNLPLGPDAELLATEILAVS